MAVREVINLGGWKGNVENTSGYLMADGWRKIGQDHGSYEHAHLFNINTGETASVCIYDYDDPRNEDRFWYNVAIDDDARVLWARKKGEIIPGLKATVVKGRKVPIGYTGVVASFKRIYDRYDRFVALYVVFEDGTRTSISNCVLAKEEMA